MELPQAGFAGAVLLVNALGELLKRTPLIKFLEAWLPLVLEVAGFGFGMLLNLGWFASLFVGLSAMGIYSGVKYTASSVDKLLNG